MITKIYTVKIFFGVYKKNLYHSLFGTGWHMGGADARTEMSTAWCQGGGITKPWKWRPLMLGGGDIVRIAMTCQSRGAAA